MESERFSIRSPHFLHSPKFSRFLTVFCPLSEYFLSHFATLREGDRIEETWRQTIDRSQSHLSFFSVPISFPFTHPFHSVFVSLSLFLSHVQITLSLSHSFSLSPAGFEPCPPLAFPLFPYYSTTSLDPPLSRYCIVIPIHTLAYLLLWDTHSPTVKVPVSLFTFTPFPNYSPLVSPLSHSLSLSMVS